MPWSGNFAKVRLMELNKDHVVTNLRTHDVSSMYICLCVCLRVILSTHSLILSTLTVQKQ